MFEEGISYALLKVTERGLASPAEILLRHGADLNFEGEDREPASAALLFIHLHVWFLFAHFHFCSYFYSVCFFCTFLLIVYLFGHLMPPQRLKKFLVLFILGR